MKMRVAVSIKLYPRKAKKNILDNLVGLYVSTVNRYIRIYWDLPENKLKHSYPPKELRAHGTKLENLASLKAWQIVKGARKSGQTKIPKFKKLLFELDETLAYIIPDFQTKEFDIWFKMYSGQRGKRIAIPGKKHRRLNYWLNRGAKIAKSFRFWKYRGEWYVTLFLNVDVPEPEPKRIIGVDIDYKNGGVLSTGEKLFGEAYFRDLRVRTKWRQYWTKYHKRVSPLKQAYNRAAKQLLKKYPNSVFVFEQLNFKGKHGRSKSFRRNYKNIPYMHLFHILSYLGPMSGSLVVQVEAKGTSITCPACHNKDKRNRKSEDLFVCTNCGLTAHADYVASVNIARRAGTKLNLPVLGWGDAEGCSNKLGSTQLLTAEGATAQSKPGAFSAPVILHAVLSPRG